MRARFICHGARMRVRQRFCPCWIRCGESSGSPELDRLLNSLPPILKVQLVRTPIHVLIFCGLFSYTCVAQELASEHVIGKLEVVATFAGPMPTGVTVADSGRIFVNFPKWGDNVQYTVAEVKGNETVPYPNADINHYVSGDDPAAKLVSVQSVVVDPTGNLLWIVDTGSIGFGATSMARNWLLLT
jgi:hypothetical protein